MHPMTPTRRGRLATALWLGRLLLGLLLVAGCGAGEKPPNILLVVLDTVRSDCTGRDGAANSVTPYLDHLAADATVFGSAWANAPWTVPSHASIFTGLLPSRHACTSVDSRLAPELPTVAQDLVEAGYETAAFFSNPWLSDRTSGLLRGFEVRREAVQPEFFSAYSRYRDGDQGGARTVRNFTQWLDERRDDRHPFFAFVNFLEAHLPYDPPLAVRRKHLAGYGADDWIPVGWGHEFNAGLHPAQFVDWDRLRALYRGDVRAADELLGQLLSRLGVEGLLDRTIVIVTSDHGENLGEHGLVEHQFSLHETLLSVPLVIRVPPALRDRLPAGRRDDPVTLADLYATILDLAGQGTVTVPPTSLSLLVAPREAGRIAGDDSVPPGRAAGSGPGRASPETIAADRPLVAEYSGPPSGLLRLLAGLNPDLDLAPLALAYRSIRIGDERLTVASDGSRRLHDLARDPGQELDLAAKRPADAERLAGRLAAICPGRLVSASAGSREPGLDPAVRRRLRALGYVR